MLACLLALLAPPARAQKWVTAWAASAQGPYPAGNASAQPDLRFAFPTPEAQEQTFRLIVKPEMWGNRVRLRFSNAFGTKPVTFDGVFIGLQTGGAALLPGSNRPVQFGGKRSVTVQPGAQVWSDAATIGWATPLAPELTGRKLAISFHVNGESGPMTWHAKGLQTSYLTPPGAGALGEFEDESPFPYSVASTFFLDALDMQAPADTRVVVCLGDSITDGTGSTLNGDDRWPDVLARRLRATGARVSVVNAGIGGNQVAGPAEYGPDKPMPGGPSALARLERDVLGLSGVTHVVWLEGINDFGAAGATPEQVRDGMAAGVKRIRAKFPGVKVVGATLTSALGSSVATHGTPEVDGKRRALNDMIRAPGLFDAVLDFDRATAGPDGKLRPEFVPSSTVGGPGDGLHPNRAGYLAMGEAVDLRLIATPPPPAPRPRPVAAPAASASPQAAPQAAPEPAPSGPITLRPPG